MLCRNNDKNNESTRLFTWIIFPFIYIAGKHCGTWMMQSLLLKFTDHQSNGSSDFKTFQICLTGSLSAISWYFRVTEQHVGFTHARTVCTRCSPRFFEHLGMRLMVHFCMYVLIVVSSAHITRRSQDAAKHLGSTQFDRFDLTSGVARSLVLAGYLL